MNDDEEDSRLLTTFEPNASCTLHTSWVPDRERGLRKVKVEDRWYRKNQIGAGSFGNVFLEATEDGRQRAVKTVRKLAAGRFGFDYKSELAALALFSKSKYLQHQIFVEFLGWFEDVEFIYLAMEYFPLGDLSMHKGDIKENDAKIISQQLLEGLEIMHEKGFTHRDLKPSVTLPHFPIFGFQDFINNIFVVQTSPSWWIKIGDFGIAKRIRAGESTELRTAAGTLGYEAPEIRGFVDDETSRDHISYTNAVDIWSFGCVIYNIVADELPFKTARALKRYCDARESFPSRALKSKMSTAGIEFLRSVLNPQPSLRPTAADVLNHAWLVAGGNPEAVNINMSSDAAESSGPDLKGLGVSFTSTLLEYKAEDDPGTYPGPAWDGEKENSSKIPSLDPHPLTSPVINPTISSHEQWTQIGAATVLGTFSPAKNLIFRIQGIPTECTNVDNVLRSILGLDTSIVVDIRSLAISHDRNTQVATFSLSSTPPCLSRLSLGQDDVWRSTFNTTVSNLDGLAEETSRRRRDITIDTHFRGLTVLWSPKNTANHKIDICAVSGLGGHAYGSFKERSGSYIWLLDSLPFELKYARIMTYGFNTKLQSNQSKQDIGDLANYLLGCLEAIKTEAMISEDVHSAHPQPGSDIMKPLIFIAHSLGGLVVKEAMIYANRHKVHHPFLDCIHGALFFGVPSRGMDIESLLPMVRNQPNEFLLHTLGPESRTLREQSITFRKMFGNHEPEIVYFYECQKSPTARWDGERYIMDGPPKFLVDRSSATDGGYWEDEVTNVYPLEKDHSHLVKFKAHDENYPAVLAALKRMLSTSDEDTVRYWKAIKYLKLLTGLDFLEADPVFSRSIPTMARELLIPSAWRKLLGYYLTLSTTLVKAGCKFSLGRLVRFGIKS